MRLTKTIATTLALTIGAASFAGTAEAGRRHHHGNGGAAAAAGIFGFAAGAILGGALAQPRYYEPRYYGPTYYEPAPVYVQPAPVYVQPAPVYYAVQPWTPAWYDYCESRYRSFDPSTGYFLGHDRQYHFCR